VRLAASQVRECPNHGSYAAKACPLCPPQSANAAPVRPAVTPEPAKWAETAGMVKFEAGAMFEGSPAGEYFVSIPSGEAVGRKAEGKVPAATREESAGGNPPPGAEAPILPGLTEKRLYDHHPENPRTPAVVEHDPRPRPLAEGEAEKGNPDRVLIRVTSVRKRLLDEDNLAEKYHVDCCRYAGLVHSDEPGKTKIEVSQRKARKGEEEHTQIEIISKP